MKQKITKKIEELTELLKENDCDFFINVLERESSHQPAKGTMKISDSKADVVTDDMRFDPESPPLELCFNSQPLLSSLYPHFFGLLWCTCHI